MKQFIAGAALATLIASIIIAILDEVNRNESEYLNRHVLDLEQSLSRIQRLNPQDRHHTL
jgi:hypothetical protein